MLCKQNVDSYRNGGLLSAESTQTERWTPVRRTNTNGTADSCPPNQYKEKNDMLLLPNTTTNV